MDETETNLTSDQISDIDAAIRKAKEAKMARDVVLQDEGEVSNEEIPTPETKSKKKKEPKSNVPKKKPHLSKVEKAADKLPMLEETEQTLYNQIVEEASPTEIDRLIKHLDHYVRFQKTRSALECERKVGQVVKIVSGDTDQIGATATVIKVQRIRCYVEVAGVAKHVYLFLSDTVPIEDVSDIQDIEDVVIEEIEADLEENDPLEATG